MALTKDTASVRKCPACGSPMVPAPMPPWDVEPIDAAEYSALACTGKDDNGRPCQNIVKSKPGGAASVDPRWTDIQIAAPESMK